MLKIPTEYRDLKRQVFCRDALRILGFVAWVAVWLCGAASYNLNHQTYPPERRMEGWRFWLLMGIIAAIGVVMFRLWRLFLDRGFRGTVECASLSRSYSSADESLVAGSGNDFRLNTRLRVRRSNGRVRRIRFEQKNGFYLYYREGEELVHFHGLPYPTNTNPDAVHGCVCSLCGAHSPDLGERCEACGLSIIDPKRLSKEPILSDSANSIPEQE